MSKRIRDLEAAESVDMLIVSADPNGVNNAAEGTFAWDSVAKVLYINTDGAAAWGEFLSGDISSEKSWAFDSPAGATGTFYYGGYYFFGPVANDFNPAISPSTALASYAAHGLLVQAAGGGGGDTTVRFSGTSIDDLGTRTPGDTQDLVVSGAGAAGTYYETSKKWLGQVTITKIAGPDLLCNYGLCKYWDNNNNDFSLAGLEVTWLGGANDNNPDIRLRHHKAAGWTYNAGSPPTPPAAVASMVGDHVTGIRVVNGQNGAWKRSNLSTPVAGGTSEGTIWEIVTTANKAFEQGNIIMRITT